MCLMRWPCRQWNFYRLWIVRIARRNVTNRNLLLWCRWRWRWRSNRLTSTNLISMRLVCRPSRNRNFNRLRIVRIARWNMTDRHFLLRSWWLQLRAGPQLIAMRLMSRPLTLQDCHGYRLVASWCWIMADRNCWIRCWRRWWSDWLTSTNLITMRLMRWPCRNRNLNCLRVIWIAR